MRENGYGWVEEVSGRPFRACIFPIDERERIWMGGGGFGEAVPR
jgi:hypothetical protein